MSDDPHAHVIDLLRHSKVAMMTFVGSDGELFSKPMATQDVDFDGTLRFIAERDSDKVHALQADARVNISYSNQGSWVSVAGHASVVDDAAKLRELWSTFTGAWLEGGPDNPNNVLIEVAAESAEYWDAPAGSKVTNLINLVKAKTTGQRFEGENETVEL